MALMFDGHLDERGDLKYNAFQFMQFLSIKGLSDDEIKMVMIEISPYDDVPG